MAGEARRRRIRELLATIGAPGLTVEAVEPALVHSSAAGEHGGASNERLEFLGDSVLGFVTASWVFNRYPEAPEGELARRKAALASDDAIAETGRRLGLGDLLALGFGERSSGGATRASNVGNAFEALLAVIERHAGMDAARSFIEREHLLLLVDRFGPDADSKTMLQEYTQARLRATPVYIDEGEEGPPHVRTFFARVEIDQKLLGRGAGPSKKAAQRAAAVQALAQLQNEDA